MSISDADSTISTFHCFPLRWRKPKLTPNSSLLSSHSPPASTSKSQDKPKSQNSSEKRAKTRPKRTQSQKHAVIEGHGHLRRACDAIYQHRNTLGPVQAGELESQWASLYNVAPVLNKLTKGRMRPGEFCAQAEELLVAVKEAIKHAQETKRDSIVTGLIPSYPPSIMSVARSVKRQVSKIFSRPKVNPRAYMQWVDPWTHYPKSPQSQLGVPTPLPSIPQYEIAHSSQMQPMSHPHPPTHMQYEPQPKYYTPPLPSTEMQASTQGYHKIRHQPQPQSQPVSSLQRQATQLPPHFMLPPIPSMSPLVIDRSLYPTTMPVLVPPGTTVTNTATNGAVKGRTRNNGTRQRHERDHRHREPYITQVAIQNAIVSSTHDDKDGSRHRHERDQKDQYREPHTTTSRRRAAKSSNDDIIDTEQRHHRRRERDERERHREHTHTHTHHKDHRTNQNHNESEHSRPLERARTSEHIRPPEHTRTGKDRYGGSVGRSRTTGGYYDYAGNSRFQEMFTPGVSSKEVL